MQQDAPQPGSMTPQRPQEPPQAVAQSSQADVTQPQNGFYQSAQPSAYVAPPTEPYRQQTIPSAQSHVNVSADSISWEASEYIHNAKGAMWMVGFVAVMVGLFALALWLQVWTFAVLVIVMAITTGYYAFRKPHIMQYRVTAGGIQINDKLYNYSEFRSFGILREGAFFSLTLMPIKRLSPGVILYFAQDDGEKIVDIIGQHLPMENIKPSPIDNLMQRLRF